MKLFFLFFISILFSFNSLSQNNHSLSIGSDLSIPSKNTLGRNTSVSLGGSIQYQLKFNAPIGLQAHIGYNHFTDGLGGKVNFLPIRGGIVGFIYKDLIYLYADAGISRYHSPTTTTTQNGFSFGSGGGYKLMFNNKQILQISAYFNLHNFRNDIFGQNYNYEWFNIRAAYGFSFGKGKQKEE